ncbi:drug resistance transporter, EmrB/QacA subfamily [Sinosporangium album]|uniref:Drug resistance transporter, EmrB/QacA subfamily n=1 Tax=Sinosporangium album TaxID=504805 RepID=A0A1G8IDW3_9ACTN|nr:MDR family MFS transporter [Sinosporangium album]SDI16740.1 drug resistance transporter, EmrB/QacA subfamily [Sinosporangium album]
MINRRAPVVAGLMLSAALAAIDATIVATAVPAIVRDLGSFSLFPWVIASYMLTQAVFTPIYGRLADVYGRKPLLIIGMGIFLIGSLLAGVAWSMPVLILARAIQGIGAGAIQPITQVLAADMYPLEERGRISGLLSSVWGVSALIGPALGGVLSELVSWRWIFLIKLPLGVAAIVVVTLWLKESFQRRPHRLDLLGTVLLMVGVVATMLGLQESSYLLAIAGFASLVAFGWWETRAAEPLIPPWVWRDRVTLSAFLSGLIVGMILIGPAVYLPTFAQAVLGAGAIAAGFALAVQSIGWPLASGLSGRLYMRIGFRDTALAGLVLIGISALMFTRLDADSPLVYAGLCTFVNGAGLGLVSSSMLIGAQVGVPREQRGTVTGSVLFFRLAGGALGASVLAAVANRSLAAHLDGTGYTSIDDAAQALENGGGEAVRQALAASVHNVFLALIVLAVLGVLAVLVMPRKFDHRS